MNSYYKDPAAQATMAVRSQEYKDNHKANSKELRTRARKLKADLLIDGNNYCLELPSGKEIYGKVV